MVRMWTELVWAIAELTTGVRIDAEWENVGFSIARWTLQLSS